MFNKLKPFLKSLLILSLVLILSLGDISSALAARSGGRIGGGSFRSPSRSYSSPGGSYRGGGYGYGGGGFGFPFLIPFFGFGGFGSLFTILIFIALANFLIKTVGNLSGQGNGNEDNYLQVSVAKVQVGLLASGRYLQKELNELAETADTDTAVGRAMVLQEASLALLRHPEYWVYGLSEAQTASMNAAESKFNQMALTERSKFTAETLSNVNNQLRQSAPSNLLEGTQESSLLTESREYIVVSLIVGVAGKLELPTINEAEDLRSALQKIAGMGGDSLLAMEILWTPQAEADTLTTDDILAHYPNLRLV
ncbi:DUF1517 domain-containing protein [Crocosphaera sp. UHCC 0190]|uniref:DUF1517 domain-containing protein n=1 Tax=Crocosphaera sp. UHCC 0190 TaxID=3110246 RepID=UPI002B1FA17F|nr:DUF1517 domain-containing protein [Crocosphaera sp. UHCC 0190]MEA5511421.1 DUF1517 domain-containing protein [Crocosphaera sp. UHCC 0190]